MDYYDYWDGCICSSVAVGGNAPHVNSRVSDRMHLHIPVCMHETWEHPAELVRNTSSSRHVKSDTGPLLVVWTGSWPLSKYVITMEVNFSAVEANYSLIKNSLKPLIRNKKNVMSDEVKVHKVVYF